MGAKLADGTWVANGSIYAGAPGPTYAWLADGSWTAGGGLLAGSNFAISEGASSEMALSVLAACVAGRLGDAAAGLRLSGAVSETAHFPRTAATELALASAAGGLGILLRSAAATIGLAPTDRGVADLLRAASVVMALTSGAAERAAFPASVTVPFTLIAGAGEVGIFPAGAAAFLSVNPSTAEVAAFVSAAAIALALSAGVSETAAFSAGAGVTVTMGSKAGEIAVFVSDAQASMLIVPTPAAVGEFVRASEAVVSLSPGSSEAAAFLAAAAGDMILSDAAAERADFQASAAVPVAFGADSGEVADFSRIALATMNLRGWFWGSAWGLPSYGGVSTMFASIIQRQDLVFNGATQRIENVINQCPVSYAYNYIRKAFAGHTDDPDRADLRSQGVYGIRTPDGPFQTPWCRHLASAQNIQRIIVLKFRDPLWEADVDDMTMKRVNVDLGNFVIASIDTLYDRTAEPLVNQYWKVLGVSPDPAKARINFRLLQTGAFLTQADLAAGDYIADGSRHAGGQRDTTTY